MRVAVVGAGFMGSAHARVLSRIAELFPGLVELSYVVDVDLGRARRVAGRFGGVAVDSVRGIEGVDFAVIAVSTRAHLTVFRELAEAGVRGVLVEKPVAAGMGEVVEFVRIAEEYGVWVAVGHVERFNPAVVAAHRFVVRGGLGDVLTFSSRRVGPFAPRAGDTDVVFDLGVHEVDSLLSFLGDAPGFVRGYTLGGVASDLNDYALMVFGWGSGFASIEVNRLTPFKQRVLYLTGSRGVFFLDYLNRVAKFYSGEEEVSLRVPGVEPLLVEDLAVLKSFAEGREPPVDLYQGFLSMVLCGAALESSRAGRELTLEDYEYYQGYRDYARRGVDGYRGFRERVEWLWELIRDLEMRLR